MRKDATFSGAGCVGVVDCKHDGASNGGGQRRIASPVCSLSPALYADATKKDMRNASFFFVFSSRGSVS